MVFFTSVLANGKQWTTKWAAQILSLLVLLQCTLLWGYTRGVAMHSMHRARHRAYRASPHDVRASSKAVYHLSHSLPASKCQVLLAVSDWLRANPPPPPVQALPCPSMGACLTLVFLVFSGHGFVVRNVT